jgi:hypothetical protein
LSKARNVIRGFTDAALDAASAYGQSVGKQALQKICVNGRKNLAVSAILNSAMLALALCAAVFLREFQTWPLLCAALINYVILGRAVFSLFRLAKTVLIPYWTVIKLVVPAVCGALRKTRSVQTALKTGICSAFNYYYDAKIPGPGRFAHKAGSLFGLVQTREELAQKTVSDFYPLVCRFLRVVLIYNVLLFTVCYGILIFIVKFFVLSRLLDVSMLDLYLYPFTWAYFGEP